MKLHYFQHERFEGLGMIADWAARHGGVSLAERRPMPPMGHFSLIRYRKA